MMPRTLFRLTLASSLVLVLLGALTARAQTVAANTARLVQAPVVNVHAFRGQGHLAFLWGTALYVLDGTTGTLRRVASAGQDASPAWSPDGRWLAFLSNGGLWVARADGSGGHRVAGLPGTAAVFSWAPRGDTLAVVINVPGRDMPVTWLVPVAGPAHLLRIPDGAGDALWSPDGTKLAYVRTPPYQRPETRDAVLYAADAIGAHPKQVFAAQNSAIWPVSWWPNGKGLLFWVDLQNSNSIAADGLPLYTLPLGGKPRLLTTALTHPAWLTRSSSGHDIVLVTGVGREIWSGKALARCDLYTAVCLTLGQPRGVVSLDPTWSIQGNDIAFVRARDEGPVGGFGSSQAFQSWVNTRTLWIETSTGAGARELTTAGKGVYEPRWSRDGHHLLYVRGNALWLVDTRGGVPIKIIGSFPTTPYLYPWGYYGYLSWAGMFAWAT